MCTGDYLLTRAVLDMANKIIPLGRNGVKVVQLYHEEMVPGSAKFVPACSQSKTDIGVI